MRLGVGDGRERRKVGADWEVTWMDTIVVAVKGGDGEHGEDGEDDDDEDYGDQYVCRRGRTALWTSELCTWSDQRWHRPELVELLFGRCLPSVNQRLNSNYMICEENLPLGPKFLT